jgi:hypothetical protein
MVNFKCCPNIFVIFLGKMNFVILLGKNFFLKKIAHMAKCQHPTVATCIIIHVVDRQPRVLRYTWPQSATSIKFTQLKRQPRVYYTCLTFRNVFYETRGTVATCIWWTRGKLCISQQPDLPRCAHVAIYTCLTVCHVYGSHTRGNLLVAKCNIFFFFFFCSDCK